MTALGLPDDGTRNAERGTRDTKTWDWLHSQLQALPRFLCDHCQARNFPHPPPSSYHRRQSPAVLARLCTFCADIVDGASTAAKPPIPLLSRAAPPMSRTLCSVGRVPRQSQRLESTHSRLSLSLH